MILIGLDPGTHTGYAEMESGKLVAVETLKIHKAMDRLLKDKRYRHVQMVYWEDARLRQWFGAAGREKLQGAGSIKRDCAIWEDFFKDYGIPNTPLPPRAGATKWTPDYFARVTGWGKRASEHGRDAACLLIGRQA